MKTQRHSHAAKSHSFPAASSQAVLALPWPTLASFPGAPILNPGTLLALISFRAAFWTPLHWHTRTHMGWQILCKWRNVTQRNHVRSIYLPYSWPLEDKNIPRSQRVLIRWFCSSLVAKVLWRRNWGQSLGTHRSIVYCSSRWSLQNSCPKKKYLTLLCPLHSAVLPWEAGGNTAVGGVLLTRPWKPSSVWQGGRIALCTQGLAWTKVLCGPAKCSQQQSIAVWQRAVALSYDRSEQQRVQGEEKGALFGPMIPGAKCYSAW